MNLAERDIESGWRLSFIVFMVIKKPFQKEIVVCLQHDNFRYR